MQNVQGQLQPPAPQQPLPTQDPNVATIQQLLGAQAQPQFMAAPTPAAPVGMNLAQQMMMGAVPPQPASALTPQDAIQQQIQQLQMLQQLMGGAGGSQPPLPAQAGTAAVNPLLLNALSASNPAASAALGAMMPPTAASNMPPSLSNPTMMPTSSVTGAATLPGISAATGEGAQQTPSLTSQLASFAAQVASQPGQPQQSPLPPASAQASAPNTSLMGLGLPAGEADSSALTQVPPTAEAAAATAADVSADSGGKKDSAAAELAELDWSEPFAGKGKKEPPFPLKLHQILANPEFAEYICWNPHGRSWRIAKPKVFEQVVIPLYFRHAKYASFMRQVNGWGFKRILSGNDHNSYYHSMFVRDFPQLSLKMKRFKKLPKSGKKGKGKDEDGSDHSEEGEENDEVEKDETKDPAGPSAKKEGGSAEAGSAQVPPVQTVNTASGDSDRSSNAASSAPRVPSPVTANLLAAQLGLNGPGTSTGGPSPAAPTATAAPAATAASAATASSFPNVLGLPVAATRGTGTGIFSKSTSGGGALGNFLGLTALGQSAAAAPRQGITLPPGVSLSISTPSGGAAGSQPDSTDPKDKDEDPSTEAVGRKSGDVPTSTTLPAAPAAGATQSGPTGLAGVDTATLLKLQEALVAAGGNPSAALQMQSAAGATQPPFPGGGSNTALLAEQLQSATQPPASTNTNTAEGDKEEATKEQPGDEEKV